MEELYIMTTALEEDQERLEQAVQGQEEDISLSEDQQQIDYTEVLKAIETTLKTISENQVREIEEYERIYERSYRTVSDDSVSDGDILDDQHEYITVSEDNIMNKHINDYTVTESLLLFISLGMLFGAFVLLVRKAVYKWK